jgi:hypothetical protein
VKLKIKEYLLAKLNEKKYTHSKMDDLLFTELQIQDCQDYLLFSCTEPGWPNTLKIIEESTHQNLVEFVNYMWTAKPICNWLIVTAQLMTNVWLADMTVHICLTTWIFQ